MDEHKIEEILNNIQRMPGTNMEIPGCEYVGIHDFKSKLLDMYKQLGKMVAMRSARAWESNAGATPVFGVDLIGDGMSFSLFLVKISDSQYLIDEQHLEGCGFGDVTGISTYGTPLKLFEYVAAHNYLKGTAKCAVCGEPVHPRDNVVLLCARAKGPLFGKEERESGSQSKKSIKALLTEKFLPWYNPPFISRASEQCVSIQCRAFPDMELPFFQHARCLPSIAQFVKRLNVPRSDAVMIESDFMELSEYFSAAWDALVGEIRTDF